MVRALKCLRFIEFDLIGLEFAEFRWIIFFYVKHIFQIKLYNKLLKLVKKALENLEDNIIGKQKMTENAEQFLNCIRKLKVPPEWQFVS